MKKTYPIAVYAPAVFQHFAISVFAAALGDEARALRELALAADAAPSDPYLAQRWKRARQTKKEP